MKEKPILFNGEMVRAILDGRKTQTRRVMKNPPRLSENGYDSVWMWGGHEWHTPYGRHTGTIPQELLAAAPYQIGDRLWVRESIRIDSDCSAILYVADQARVFRGKHFVGYAYYPQDWPWKHSVLSSRFMPKWATRIWLEVTDKRAEQVQDITYDDILAEGWDSRTSQPMTEGTAGEDAFLWFRILWDSINANPFADNSWAWVYEFKRLETPGGAKQ